MEQRRCSFLGNSLPDLGAPGKILPEAYTIFAKQNASNAQHETMVALQSP
jgi:hypothetical protein